MRAAVATFIYPARSIETYARECLASLAAQSDRAFELVVFNDGFAAAKDIVHASGIVGEIVPVDGHPAAIRRQAIARLLAEGFDIVVFADIDDRFDENRVATAKRMLAGDTDVVVNDLTLFGTDRMMSTPMWGDRLSEGQIMTVNLIRHGNCFGMSNTAVRLRAIPAQALAPDNVVAFDWLFYTRALAAGARARFTGATRTHYRQHDNNTAALGRLSDAQITRGLLIKYEHYRALGDPKAAAFAHTLQRLGADLEGAARYCEAVRQQCPVAPFWWEPLKTIEELAHEVQ
jgi:glycosyltransferase involved in cell wall biosynthesis